LQVHYGVKLGAPGAAELAAAFKETPALDLHQRVADLAKISRKEAKTINIGLSYGMGDAKLGNSLGLSFYQAKNLKFKFNSMVPFLQMIVKHSEKTIRTRGYLKTLGGRKLYNEPKFERKAFNKLIQGGGADQTNRAVVDCYRAGILIALYIHDEFALTNCTAEEAEKVKFIMENSTQLLVPSISEIEKGKSWGELKKV
jgi:DNA polymerase-1